MTEANVLIRRLKFVLLQERKKENEWVSEWEREREPFPFIHRNQKHRLINRFIR